MKREKKEDVKGEILMGDRFERAVGSVFWLDGRKFMVVEADGDGCKGCSLWMPGIDPCLSKGETGCCAAREDGRRVVFRVMGRQRYLPVICGKKVKRKRVKRKNTRKEAEENGD